MKTTWITQLVFGFKVGGQLLVCLKTPRPGEIAKLVILTASAPSLYSVILKGGPLLPGPGLGS